MATKYLDISSNYRDRNQYPNPSRFVVEISQTGNQVGPLNARDPVADSSPILFWSSSFDENTASTSVTITGITLTNSLSDPTTFLITAGQGDLRTITNYYNGAILSLTDSATTPVTIRTRILAYKLISSTGAGDTALVTVSTALPANFPTGATTGNIQNPTNNTATSLVPQLFIPTGFLGDNYYVNYIIQYYDPTNADPLSTTQTVTITAYDGTTRLATLSSNTTVSWLTANGMFIMRKAKITTSGAFVYPTTLPSTTSVVQLASTASSDSGLYTGSFLRMLTPVPINTAGYSTNQSSYADEFKIANYIAGNGTTNVAILAGTTNAFSLTPSTSSSVDNYYVGGLLTLDLGGGTQETLRVTSYTGSTHTGTVASNWTQNHASGASWMMRTAILATAVTLPAVQAPQTQNLYEIELFTRDNWVPFSYTGSLVSQQESVCTELELVSLTIPNSLLKSSRGGRAIFYPYLYVELQPISASANYRGILYSNNPNAYKMMFRVVCDDTTPISNTLFLHMDSDSQTATVKFKPNDSFLFAVYQPDGSLLETVAQDYYSPTEPNPLVQISAIFSMKRSPQ